MRKASKRGVRPPQRKGQPPVWALRLAVALVFGGVVNKKGHVDKVRAGQLLNVCPKTIESWITGRTQPRYETLMRVREITRVSLDWILTDVARPEIIDVEKDLEGGPRIVEIMKK